jgi:hypothetical protein
MWRLRHETLICFSLYWSKTWPFALREKHDLRVFESRIMKIVHESTKEEETEG